MFPLLYYLFYLLSPPISQSLFYSPVAMVAVVQSQTTTSGVMCYVCSGTTGGCADEFSHSSSIEQDCSEYGYTDDNGCSKYKSKTNLLGSWITTSKGGGVEVSLSKGDFILSRI